MALTGLQIQKLLPKTNCKECGSNTCLAFAMKLAAKKAELSECPYASDEAKRVLGAAAEPPVKGLRFGAAGTVAVGEETVLYRHEKTFVNRTVLAVGIDASQGASDIEKTLSFVKDYSLDRVGEKLCVEMVAVTQGTASAADFGALAKKASELSGKPLILRSADPDALCAAAAALKGTRCLLSSANAASVEKLSKAATENGHALALSGSGLDEIASLAQKLKAGGFNDIVLELPARGLAERFQLSSIARRAALKDEYKPLGYAFLRFLDSGDSASTIVQAVTEIDKYGGICVLPGADPAELVSLLTLRQNIYTDPQKPIQVDPKVYAIGEPDEKSPVFVTTNFSLTYFIVSGEIENSGTSAWLLVPQCEGMSVLTAWAAGKFSGAAIAKALKESGLEDRVTTREIVIPGYVAQISGELEENLPGWKAVVGPQEAADIESFVKARLR
jgi:acetyl-CoA decarbonylase/synthase, CODH/ACS complex subunit gamma